MTYPRSGIFLAPFHDLSGNPVLALERDMELLQHLFRDVATFPIVPADITDRCQYMIDGGSACIGTPDNAVAFIDRLAARRAAE